MKTILVATDFSAGAQNALEYAAALAKGLDARLVIFNAFSLAAPTGSVPSYVPNVDVLISDNNQRISAMGEKIAEEYQIEVDCVTTTDLMVDGLKKQVRKQRADLVVMGMNGHSLFTRIFGSSTTAVIKEASFPVLVVPVEARFNGISRILFACDFKKLTKRSRLTIITELLLAFRAQLKVLHIEQDEQDLPQAMQQLQKIAPLIEELLEGIRPAYRTVYAEDVIDGIENATLQFHADLVVIMPHRKGFWESLLHPSLTKKMAIQSHVPLMSIPDRLKTSAPKRERKPVQEPH